VALDLDDTVLGDAAAARRFRESWAALRAESRPLLVYNTSRSVGDTRWLALEHMIPDPEFIIGGIGTELHDPLDQHVGEQFRADIMVDWNLERVQEIVSARPNVRAQPEQFLNPCKLSWYWPRASAGDIIELERTLQAANVRVTVLYTEDRLLDIIPLAAGKGNALAWLCRRAGIPLNRVIVAGASANNYSMFALPGVTGILLHNADPRLSAAPASTKPFQTESDGADGVLAGLAHFGVMAPSPDFAPEKS
jgi:sucrose-6F-phosphate phosphohydrolase